MKVERSQDVEIALEFGSPEIRAYVIDLISAQEAADAAVFALEHEVAQLRARLAAQ